MEPISSPALNYGGVALALVTLGLLVLVQPEATSTAVTEVARIAPEALLSERLLSAEEAAAGSSPLTDALASYASTADEAHGRLRATRHKDASALINAGDVLPAPQAPPAPSQQPAKVWDRLPPVPRRVFGTTLALLAGVLSGSTFTAPQ